ncbi:MAG TPA: hypothetical protein VGM80_07940 [Gaiellaceae bacterium]
MKSSFRSAACVGAVAGMLLPGLAPGASAGAGKAVSIICTGKTTVDAQGGSGTVAGVCHGSLSGALKGAGGGTEALPCYDYTGKVTIKGHGSSLAMKATPDQQICFKATTGTVIPVAGHVNVTGATGAFRARRGTLAFKARYNRETGALTVTFTGTL